MYRQGMWRNVASFLEKEVASSSRPDKLKERMRFKLFN